MDEYSILNRALQDMDINYNYTQLRKLIKFIDMLIEANLTVNLIGPSGRMGILKRHILDSLAPISCRVGKEWKSKGNTILDIGSGGGFPGIPLSILLPKSRVVLLEKSGKKSAFLSNAAEKLLLGNITIVSGRAEELAREEKWRETFDIVVARAVTKFNILLELSIPFCNINGKIVFYKSKKVYSEMEASREAISKLGGRIGELVKVNIPELEEFRTLLVIDKVENTLKKYPRIFSQIKKKPL